MVLEISENSKSSQTTRISPENRLNRHQVFPASGQDEGRKMAAHQTQIVIFQWSLRSVTDMFYVQNPNEKTNTEDSEDDVNNLNFYFFQYK